MMMNGRVMLTVAVLSLAGAVAMAQGGARAHADLKGDGVTGKVELVERIPQGRASSGRLGRGVGRRRGDDER